MRTRPVLPIAPALTLVVAALAAAHGAAGCTAQEPVSVTQRSVEHVLITQADVDALAPGERLSVDLSADHVAYHFQLDPPLDTARILLVSGGRSVAMDVAVAEMQAGGIDPLAAADDRLILTGDPRNFVELSASQLGTLEREGTLVVDGTSQPGPTPQSTDNCDPDARYDNVTPAGSGGQLSFWSQMLVAACDVCVPGAVEGCYYGPEGTEGVGPCHGGQKTCLPDGTAFGPCLGQVVPQPELCLSPDDLDCSGDPGCGPGYLWSRRFGDSAYQSALAVAGDAADNVLVTGKFAGTLDFGVGALVSGGSQDIFVAKLDSAGNALWSKGFGDSAFQEGDAIATDAAGNVVIAGLFAGTVDFGAGPLASAGGYDGFVAKLDPSGALLWAKRYGDSSGQSVTNVRIDGAGNIVIAGVFGGTIDLGAGPHTAPTAQGAVFVAKLDPAGNALWSRQFGQSGISVDGLGVDSAGTIAITGSLWGTADFGAGPVTSAGGSDGYVAVFDTGGSSLWSRRFGDADNQAGKGVAVDGGDVVLTGRISGAADLGGGPLVSVGSNAFAAKYDAAGNLIWADQLPSFAVTGNDVVIDAGHNVVLTGVYNKNGSFGDRVLTTSNTSAWARFLLKLDPAGNVLWSKGFPITSMYDDRGVAVDSSGHVLYSGILLGTTDYGGGPLTGAGGFDAVVARFAP